MSSHNFKYDPSPLDYLECDSSIVKLEAEQLRAPEQSSVSRSCAISYDLKAAEMIADVENRGRSYTTRVYTALLEALNTSGYTEGDGSCYRTPPSERPFSNLVQLRKLICRNSYLQIENFSRFEFHGYEECVSLMPLLFKSSCIRDNKARMKECKRLDALHDDDQIL